MLLWLCLTTTTTFLGVSDYYIQQNHADPQLDVTMGGTNDILQYSGFQSDHYTFFEFKRYLNTNDTTSDHPLVLGDMIFIWAHGDDGDLNLGYHSDKRSNRGIQTLNIATGETTFPIDLALWHGACMTLAWGFCISFGIFTARYLKYYYWWFPLHIFSQSAGILLVIAGFVIALLMTQGNHFRTLHSLFGITVVSLSFLAGFMGIFSHFLYDPKRASVPIWPDQAHWWIGRLAVLLSYATIILGMILYGVDNIIPIMFGILIGMFLLTYLYLDVYRWKEKKDGRSLTPEYD